MSYYVFFSGLPKSYPQQGIRDLFSRCGNVVSLKISAPRGSTSNNNNNKHTVTDTITQSGLIEYADEASQQAAIALFNGYIIETPRGSVRIRVGASSGGGGGHASSSASAGGVGSRIRGRDATTSGATSGAPGSGIENSAAGGSYKHEKFIDSDLSTSEHLIARFEEKRSMMMQRQQQQGDTAADASSSSPFLPRRSIVDPLQASLLKAPEHELREAVEQLRVLCAEQPENAKLLLETFPQLRRAVCMILQKEEKLPVPLPPEAFIERQQQQQQKQTKNTTTTGDSDSNNATGTTDAASTTTTTTTTNEIDPEEQEQIQNIINELSPEALAEMLSADFESQEGQMEESVRQHFMKIQRQLRAMTEE